MKHLSLKISALLAAGLILASGIGSAQATPISLNQWYTFGFGGPGSALFNGSGYGPGLLSMDAPDAPWTFTLPGMGTLVVTDGFNSGDRFELSDFGSSLGQTSVPTQGDDCGGDELACLANANFSSGSFALGAGNHSITGTASLSPFNGGAGFFIVQTETVPEPGTLALFGLGLAGLGFARRRKRAA